MTCSYAKNTSALSHTSTVANLNVIINQLTLSLHLLPGSSLLPSVYATDLKDDWTEVDAVKPEGRVCDELVRKFNERSFDDLFDPVRWHDGWQKFETEELHHETSR